MRQPAMRRRVSRTAFLLATSALAAAIAAPALAQSSSASDVQEEVVVTANKRVENILTVPASVTAVGEGLIQRLQANSLSDLAAYVPGLNVQSSGTDANRLIIRGLTTGPNDLSPSVGVYIDDAPFGSNSGYALGALFSPDVDPFDLERVEVLRGPQGTLYGASTLGGLVKYVTKSPDLTTFGGHIRIDYSDSDDTGADGFALRGGVNIPIIKDKVALRISGFDTYTEGDLTDVRTGADHLNSQRRQGGRVDLELKPVDELTVDLIAITDHSTTPHVGVVTGNAQTLQPTYGQYAGFDYVDSHTSSNYDVYQGNVRYRLPGGMTATSTTSYSIYEANERADDTTVFQTAFGPLGSLFEFPSSVKPTTKRFTEELRLASPQGEKFDWLVGAYFDRERSDYYSSVDSTYMYGATPPAILAPTAALLANYETVDLHETYSEAAGFANGTFHLTPTIDLGAGVRYSAIDQYLVNNGSGYLALLGVIPASQSSSESDNVWTESFDARWRFVPGSMVYARIARGYRPGGPNTSGPSFEPDTTWNYEVGVKSSALGGKLTGSAALFYIDWSNVQLNFFNGTNTITGNAGDAKSEGVELEANYTPLRGLVLGGNFAYTDAEITHLVPGATGGAVVGDQLPYNSKIAYTLHADYSMPLSSTLVGSVGASLRYKSAFNTTFPGDTGTRFYRLPETTFFDLRTGLTYEQFAVNFQILNLFDQRRLSSAEEYLAVPKATADAAGEPVFLGYTPGRTYGVSLTAKF